MSETYKALYLLSDTETVPVGIPLRETPTTIDRCTGIAPPERLEIWNGLEILGNLDPDDEEEAHLAPSTLSLNTAKIFIDKIPFWMPFPSHLMGGDDGNIIFRWKSPSFDWIATVSGSTISLSKRNAEGYELTLSENMPLYSSTIPDGVKGILTEMRSLLRS